LSNKKSSSENYACDLLSPAIALFKALGMDLPQIQQIVSDAYDYVADFKGYKKIDFGVDILSAVGVDVVTTWAKSAPFLDSQGQPRVLPLRGKNSFFSLVHAVDTNFDPMQILHTLVRYKTIEKVRGENKYKLIAQYYNTDSDNRILIDSAVSFLWDANKTIANRLKHRKIKEKKDPFWFRVETDNLTKKDMEKFMVFMRERIMLFLYETEDWLQAHGTKRVSGDKKVVQRVGLGVFAFANPRLNTRKIK
jgi:hypothetical protein